MADTKTTKTDAATDDTAVALDETTGESTVLEADFQGFPRIGLSDQELRVVALQASTKLPGVDPLGQAREFYAFLSATPEDGTE